MAKTETKETYIQKMKKQKEEKLKVKQKEDEKYNLDKHDKNIQMLDDFICKSVKNLKVETLSIRDSIPYWINTNCLALNWIITNDFNKGLPGCRTIMFSGECLDYNTKIKLQVNDENFLKYLKNFLSENEGMD